MQVRSLAETDIQAKVTAAAAAFGLVSIRINVSGRKGWPDYGYGFQGRMCFIEYKKPGEKPEPLQAHVHDILRKAGFYVYVIDDIEEGIEALRLWKARIYDDTELARFRQGYD